ALAHQVGAELRDLEFLQFHPTAVKLPGVNPAPLVSEAVRGAGAILVDRDGRRFLPGVDARAELASRDVVARAVAAAAAGGTAWRRTRSSRRWSSPTEWPVRSQASATPLPAAVWARAGRRPAVRPRIWRGETAMPGARRSATRCGAS